MGDSKGVNPLLILSLDPGNNSDDDLPADDGVPDEEEEDGE